jgi:hypothetical protein
LFLILINLALVAVPYLDKFPLDQVHSRNDATSGASACIAANLLDYMFYLAD